MDFVADLDTPLLSFSAEDHFSLRDAVTGVHVTGSTGSGKTSGPGNALARAYLRAGFGALILAAKPEEVESWLVRAKECGRADSVIVFGERGNARFNFIAYELAKQGAAGLNSVIECLMRIVESSRVAGPSSRSGNQTFWDNASRQLLRNTVPILYAATGTVRIPDIVRFVGSAPTSLEQAHDKEWQKRSFMCRMMDDAEGKPVHPLSAADLGKIGSYWYDQFAQLDPKTRGNIAISLSTVLDRFNMGRLEQLFCSQTNLVPELTFHGAIIILDMPALTWKEDGIVAQRLFKYVWQRAVLARNALPAPQRQRPVVLWADEAQYFVDADSDCEFQSTCRASLACTVYMTQSLPTYYARMGGDQPKHSADMLLAGFANKLFLSNGCPETNKWAAETIGRGVQARGTYSAGTSHGRAYGMNEGESTNAGWSSGSSWSRDSAGNYSSGGNSGSTGGTGENSGRNRGLNTGESYTRGFNETMDYEVEPNYFGSGLKTGGPANGGIVSGVWYRAGALFTRTKKNYLIASFAQ